MSRECTESKKTAILNRETSLKLSTPVLRTPTVSTVPTMRVVLKERASREQCVVESHLDGIHD